MVQILPESESFGRTFAKNLGTGLSQGIGKGADFAERLMEEKIKRGMLIKQAKGSIPNKLRMDGNDTNSDQLPFSQRLNQSGSNQSRGESQAYMSPQQVAQQAAMRTQEKLENGIITSYEDELNTARQKNAEIGQYQRYQEEVGAKSDQALEKIMPKATDEHKALLRRRAEEFGTQNLSPAELDRKIALETKKFSNQIASIQKSLPPKRFYSHLSEAALGKGRSEEKARESTRLKLKPILDEGLYDTARNLLDKAGYAPEETEEVISNLGEQAKKTLSAFPKVKQKSIRREGFVSDLPDPNPTEKQAFFSNIGDVLKTDPNANLILLRKAYEDKGINWRTYKDEIDSLMQNEQFIPNEDQMKMLDYLDEPPLNRLGQIFYNLKLIGR